MIQITHNVSIGEDDIRFTYARSPGPGGQRVNKVATSVTLWFDVGAGPSLNDAQRDRIRRKLATRINKDGVLRVVSRQHRTQAANRREAVERFIELVAGALRRRRPRKKTRPTRASIERRLDEKARRGRQKRDRSRRFPCKDDG